MRDLEGVIVAFDLDNTLLDPSGVAYHATVAKFLDRVDLGLTADEAATAYETVRALGPALALLGLGNPLHERGHPHGLATLCILSAKNLTLRAELGVDDEAARELRVLLIELNSLDRAVRRGSMEARLQAELALQALSRNSDRADRARTLVRTVSEYPVIVDWAYSYADIESGEHVIDPRPLVQMVAQRGGTPVVISDGLWDVQRKKLERLGLVDFFGDRILLTETAAAVPESQLFISAFDRMLNAFGSNAEQALALAWRYRCLLYAWSAKSPAFFARCLHAVHAGGDAPAEGLRSVVVSDPDAWAQKPLRFVMVGDRYDRDIAPVMDLLGDDVGVTVHLRAGKYANLHERRTEFEGRGPRRVVGDWGSLSRLLGEELRADQIRPIVVPPPIVPNKWMMPDLLERGTASHLTAMRTMAEAIARTSGKCVEAYHHAD